MEDAMEITYLTTNRRIQKKRKKKYIIRTMLGKVPKYLPK